MTRRTITAVLISTIAAAVLVPGGLTASATIRVAEHAKKAKFAQNARKLQGHPARDFLRVGQSVGTAQEAEHAKTADRAGTADGAKVADLSKDLNCTACVSASELDFPIPGQVPAWLLAGNAGTNSANDFLGTTDNEPLVLKVNGTEAAQFVPNGGDPGVTLGSSTNQADVTGGIAAGGATNLAQGDNSAALGGALNSATGPSSGVLGGVSNTASGLTSAVVGGGAQVASGDRAIVAGGNTNIASGILSATLGGLSNIASGILSSAIGGLANQASGSRAAVLGGGSNIASGADAAVLGGNTSTAAGAQSLAVGNEVSATHNGSKLFADLTAGPFASTADNEFAARAAGGFRFVTATDGAGTTTVQCTLNAAGNMTCPLFTTSSDRNLKTGFEAVDSQEVLDKVRELPVTSWSFKTDPGSRHIGPTAQDFHEAFGLGGSDDKHISTVDEGGVSFAAIKGLADRVESQQRQIDELQEQVERLSR